MFTQARILVMAAPSIGRNNTYPITPKGKFMKVYLPPSLELGTSALKIVLLLDIHMAQDARMIIFMKKGTLNFCFNS